MRLWHRSWDLQIGTLRIRGNWQTQSLDVGFDISKDTTRAPNTANVRVYNLSPTHRRRLESEDNIRIILRAGYEEGQTTLFSGTVHAAESRRRRKPAKRLGRYATGQEGVDVITTLEAQDGGRSYSSATVERSFGPGTSLIDVIRVCVEAMVIGEGNLTAAEVGNQIYQEGTTIHGRAWRELDRLIRSAGLTWSVQDGNLQVLRGRTPLRQSAVRLSPSTGLVGSPATDADKTVSITALLMPGLTPGRQVVLDSQTISGSYRIKRVQYRGETFGPDWYAHLTLERY